MSKQLKLRRGTTAQHSTFTGASGEVTVDTDKKTLVVHDGTTAGGNPVLSAVNPSYSGTLTGGTGVVNLGSGQFYKDTSGNVGLGTSSPSAKLHVKQSGANYYGIWAEASSNDSVLRLFNNGTVSGVSSSYGSTGSYLPLAFYTSDTERMRIDSSGNVGIGASSPSVKLDVNGAVRSFGSTNPYFQMNDGTNNAYMQLSANIFNFTTPQSIPITFGIGGTERARIDTSGNLLFNSGYGSVATAYGCRAWVNFNGTGSNATNQTIRASGNVSSVYKNASGDYTINFAAAMPDTSYVVTGSVQRPDNFGDARFQLLGNTQSGVVYSTTAVRVQTFNYATVTQDVYTGGFAIFR